MAQIEQIPGDFRGVFDRIFSKRLWDKLVELIKQVNYNTENIIPYKKYVALLTQSGTDNPVVHSLENTLGVDVTITRSNAGDYLVTATGAFPDQDKVAVFFGTTHYNGVPGGVAADYFYASSYYIGTNELGLGTIDIKDHTMKDGGFYDTMVEIRVYN